MDVKRELKILLAKEGLNFSTFSKKYQEFTGKKLSVQNLYNKFSKNTIRVVDLAEFCDVLGYEIEFKKI